MQGHMAEAEIPISTNRALNCDLPYLIEKELLTCARGMARLWARLALGFWNDGAGLLK